MEVRPTESATENIPPRRRCDFVGWIRRSERRRGKGEKVRQERTAVAVMRRAGQTPHGARPNREEVGLRLGTCWLGASNLRVGRLSRAVMRGPEEWPSCRSNPADRIRLTGPAATKFLNRSFDSLRSLRISPAGSRPQTGSTYRSGCHKVFQ
jgi:hypothetical protein